jgi:hypothetical protein
MFYVPGDTGFVYLLKGYRSEFYRFNVAGQTWETLDDAPAGVRNKWDKGSWLCGMPGAGGWQIYAHKARYHELHVYDAAAQAWDSTSKTGMPFSGMTGRKKKSKDGGSAARSGDEFFCLKGGNTQEFWEYDPATDLWTELDTMPSLGSTGRKKRVKYGADIASFGFGAFFALKGNKTVEMWRYVTNGDCTALGTVPACQDPGQGLDRTGVVVGPNGTLPVVWQNPITSGCRVLSYSLPRPGPVKLRVFDISGREVLVARSLDNSASGSLSLDLRHLSAGVYLVRFEAGGFVSTQKLAVQH